LQDLTRLQKVVDKSKKPINVALGRAVNFGLKKGRTLISKEIRKDIRFSATYLNENNNDRLKITEFATFNKPTGVIRARDRDTQLIRFATPQSINKLKNRKGKTKKQISRLRPSVKVRKGGALRKPKYFWVKLKGKGGKLDDENANEGLAFRTPGKFKSGKDKFKVVYSVSVQQAMKQEIPEVEPKILAIVDKEFDRQLGVIFDARN